MKLSVRLALILGLGLLLAVTSATAQLFSSRNASAPAYIDVLDIGQGDAILIRSPEGKTVLIDAGLDKSVVQRIQECGVKTIDMVVVSHHHTDHYGGMDDVISTFHPRLFLATASKHTTSTFLKLLRLVRDSGMQAIQPTSSARKIQLGSLTLTVLPQPPTNDKEENDNSIGIRVRHGSVSMLLTGDSEEGSRRWWAKKCPDLVRDCDVLKLAHHGSRNGTDAAWLDLVQPKLAVASLGKGNDYGHPHSETLELLKQYRIPLLRTDQKGTITLRSDGRKIELEPRQYAQSSPPVRDDAVATAKSSRRTTSRATPPSPSRGNGMINLNTASRAQLETLPGVGPSTARRIIEGRPYKSIDDLRELQGMSQTRFSQIQPNVVVR